MVKVHFPNLFMKLISLNKTVSPPVAKLIVPPKMTKTEVKEYLTKIYNVNVITVHTANFLGKWKRLFPRGRLPMAYKRRNWKMAYVFYDDTVPANDPTAEEKRKQYTLPTHPDEFQKVDVSSSSDLEQR